MSSPTTSPPPYNPSLCTYSNIKLLLSKHPTSSEMCKQIAQGICNGPHHYFNTYKLYFCYLNENKGLYILISTFLLFITFFSLNYIRRNFYTIPVLNFRKILGISDFMSEAILVPLSFGIVPIFIRIHGSYKDLDLSFNYGATVGTMLTLSCFVIGICSVVLKLSRKVDKGRFLLDMVFIGIGCFMLFVVGAKREVEWIDAVVMIGLWIVYLFMVFWKGLVDKSKFSILEIFSYFFSFLNFS